jgi:hypothetical protein
VATALTHSDRFRRRRAHARFGVVVQTCLRFPEERVQRPPRTPRLTAHPVGEALLALALEADHEAPRGPQPVLRPYVVVATAIGGGVAEASGEVLEAPERRVHLAPHRALSAAPRSADRRAISAYSRACSFASRATSASR